MSRSLRRVCLASSVALGLGCGLAAVPVAAADSVLNACINGGNGGMRLVAAADTCHANETRVSWNVSGPAGPAGPAGPEGPAGPAGPAGSGASGPPFVWVCTPVSFPNAGGNVRADLNVFNAGGSTANVAVNFLDINGANLAGVAVPLANPPVNYPGDSGASTVAVLPAHTRNVSWMTPQTYPDPTTNVVFAIRVTSDQPISVGVVVGWSGFIPIPCNFVHP